MTMARWSRCAIAAVSSMLVGSVPSSAAVYDWTASISFAGSRITGAGQLTTQDTLTNGGYLVTSISGTYGKATIISLLPVNTRDDNDNLVFTNYPKLDYDGIAFSVNLDPGAGEGTQVNVYFKVLQGYTDNGETDYDPSPSAFTLTSAQTVPEPATGMMIGVGLIGLFLMRRNRSR